MNASRIMILTCVASMLLVGTAAAQAPEPANSAPEPPAQPPASGQPAAGALPDVPPSQTPGDAAPGFPPTAPTMQPGLPNLQAAPPDVMQGLGTPPGQSTASQSNNPLLKLFDTDGDGVLSGDEVEAAPARLWELDRNFDAELSIDELGLVLAPRWQERRRGVRGYVPEDEAAMEPQLPLGPERKLGEERPQFQVYPLRGLEPRQTLATLQNLLKDQPDARLTYDGRTQSILALATPSAQTRIRDALASLLQGDRSGIPGLAPAMEPAAAPEAGVRVVPRPVPLYNRRAADVLRILKQVFRDRIVEPAAESAPADPRFPGAEPLPMGNEPTVPPGKMVIGEGAAPNSIVISAQDELFFEVLDLIERLDEEQEPPAETPPPVE